MNEEESFMTSKNHVCDEKVDSEFAFQSIYETSGNSILNKSDIINSIANRECCVCLYWIGLGIRDDECIVKKVRIKKGN